MNATLLLLADGRFPAGGHAHSHGLEAAVAAGRVTGIDELESFLRGRLATTGLVTAAFAAAARLAATNACALVQLDVELDARTASPASRLASRRQGRALLRAGRVVWPSPLFDNAPERVDGCHHATALGLTAAAAMLTAGEAASVATYGILTGPASAAVRLLGLDPYQTNGMLARLAGACDRVARRAVAAATKAPAELPANTAPLADIYAETHATWEVRLFAS